MIDDCHSNSSELEIEKAYNLVIKEFEAWLARILNKIERVVFQFIAKVPDEMKSEVPELEFTR